MKFLLALRTLYLSFSRGSKERTSFNHCEIEGAVLDFQLRRISLRASKEANATAFDWGDVAEQSGGIMPKMAVWKEGTISVPHID